MATVLNNIGTLVHLADPCDEESSITNGVAIVIDNGVITNILDSQEALDEYGSTSSQDYTLVDLDGRAVVPGLIDSHTHLLWAGDRSREVRWRHEGRTYVDISEMGGGIVSTVNATRAASEEQLHLLGVERLKRARRSGTTHMEVKSGYGLDTPNELKLLSVANALQQKDGLPSLDLTWMGAHDAPPNMTMDDYVDQLLSDQMPAVVEQGLARSMDVFCEPGWFTNQQTSDLLESGRDAGLALRLHIDEFENGGGGELASEFSVDTADHAYHTPLDVRKSMTQAGVNVGYLPGTPHAMGDPFPNMIETIDEGIEFTLATDYNPNCQTLSLPFVGSLMVQRAGVHPLEALKSVTVRAAKITPHPSGRVHGQLVEGAAANLNIINGVHWESWALQPSHTPFHSTMIDGELHRH